MSKPMISVLCYAVNTIRSVVKTVILTTGRLTESCSIEGGIPKIERRGITSPITEGACRSVSLKLNVDSLILISEKWVYFTCSCK